MTLYVDVLDKDLGLKKILIYAFVAFEVLTSKAIVIFLYCYTF